MVTFEYLEYTQQDEELVEEHTVLCTVSMYDLVTELI